ncbi:MAG: hypothetical protein OEM38_04020 [Gammaproteobacteria bacterium]|nr:hypothetical protein [Gammaproteobacteria bacterium]
MTLRNDNQADINDRAAKILKTLNGENSSSCVLSLVSVIDAIAFSDKASDAFKRDTAMILRDQADRIELSLMPVYGLLN